MSRDLLDVTYARSQFLVFQGFEMMTTVGSQIQHLADFRRWNQDLWVIPNGSFLYP